MFLLDSNIIIYSAKEENSFLREYISNSSFASAVSIISKIEVLGYHRLTSVDKQYFESCFYLLHVFYINSIISEKAIELRQSKKMSLGDSVIASTALLYDYTLITRNIEDFSSISELKLYNPFN